jgi:hypothetical protein
MKDIDKLKKECDKNNKMIRFLISESIKEYKHITDLEKKNKLSSINYRHYDLKNNIISNALRSFAAQIANSSHHMKLIYSEKDLKSAKSLPLESDNN